jgi:DNA-binding FadR family transcriptional regulator
LVDRVVQTIEGQILGGRLTPGTMLPPERELAMQLAVSRTVLREAVRALVAKGLLETRHGIGTTVSAINPEEIVKRLALLLRVGNEPATYDHLHQIHCLFEVESAGSAAEHATENDIEVLGRLAAELWPSITDPEQYARKDHDFHRRLAQTTHNPLMVSLRDAVHDLYCRTGNEDSGSIGRAIGDFRRLLESEPGSFEREMRVHVNALERVAEAVARHEPERARQAMRDHLAHALTIHARLTAVR